MEIQFRSTGKKIYKHFPDGEIRKVDDPKICAYRSAVMAGQLPSDAEYMEMKDWTLYEIIECPFCGQEILHTGLGIPMQYHLAVGHPEMGFKGVIKAGSTGPVSSYNAWWLDEFVRNGELVTCIAT